MTGHNRVFFCLVMVKLITGQALIKSDSNESINEEKNHSMVHGTADGVRHIRCRCQCTDKLKVIIMDIPHLPGAHMSVREV